ncbi:acyl-CoA dehydrogenase [Ottowia sp. VDI28]|uniref:acyl-CoA dehydrogenase n=1 Tax=Ottowia sp. VDI28 TaxID=3133968 RepID=UPI003C2E3CC5
MNISDDAIADSARDLYRHLEARIPGAAAVPDGAARTGRVHFGKLAPLADTRALWQAIAAAGWLGILVAEQRGGLGLAERDLLTVAQEAGRHPRQPALIVAAAQVSSCLDACDSEAGARMRRRFLEGELLAGLAWQERLGALDEEAPQLRWSEEPGGYGRLSGCKIAVSPLAAADAWLVLAAGAQGPVLVQVNRGTPGLHLRPDECADGSDIGTLEFEDVRVEPGHCLLIGTPALAAVQHACDRARLVQSAMLVGGSSELLQRTLEHLRTRVQFGRPLGSFQALQHRCADMYLDISVSRACLEEILTELADEPDRLARLASRAKARCAAMGIRLARTAIQLHGAIGATDELSVSGFFRRALHLSAWLGNATAHQQRWYRLRPTRAEREFRPRAPYPPEAPLEELDEAQFRTAVRDFLEANFPPELRFLPRNAKWSEWQPFFHTLGRRGWAAPAWPKEHGGLALPQERLLAMFEEQERFGVPRAPTESSVGMLGQLLIRFGTEAQKQRFLPGILTGRTIWCQGYSEPNAGSDLASLRTRARQEGDHFVINGQKIWTSMAAEATHMFALVRTRDEGPKQAGISFVLIDMETPGITVRPIRDMAGHDKFCEVFFDEVRVPSDNLVGELHGGWALAKALLGFERVTVGTPNNARVALYQLESLGQARGLFKDSAFTQRFAALELDTLDVGALYSHFAAYIRRGDELPASVGMCKIWATETCERITAATVEAAAEDGQSMGTLDLGGERIGTAGAHMTALYGFIYAGTNDVQRNILARQVLHLPD